MSLDSWKAEFYPVPANKVPEDEAIQHSLRKWIGLRQENLNKHDCFINDYYVEERFGKHDRLKIDTGSCALCSVYLDDYDMCDKCPLYAALGGKSCGFGIVNVFYDWVKNNDPEPMIAALRKALREAPDIHVKGFDIIYEPDWQACDLCGTRSPLIQKCCNCPNNVCTFCQSVSEHCNTCLNDTDIKTHYSIDVGY